MAKNSDPIPISSVLDNLMRSRGWSRRLEASRVEARWDSVVGTEVAKHCRPVQLRDDGILEVTADTPAWATQLAYLRGTLLDRLAEVCGPGLVRDVQVRAATSRRGRGTGR
jgi:predicted nucleic acid-binding Zn ribbon protein